MRKAAHGGGAVGVLWTAYLVFAEVCHSPLTKFCALYTFDALKLSGSTVAHSLEETHVYVQSERVYGGNKSGAKTGDKHWVF